MKKFISFIAILLILSGMCCFSAFAALDYTDTYYMNGYKMYGSTVMNTKIASSSTYDENINYAKMVHMSYYYSEDSTHNIKGIYRGSKSSFVTNGFDAYSVSYTYTSATDYYLGAIGVHGVKASSYMIWKSHPCYDDSHVGSILPDYSDVD